MLIGLTGGIGAGKSAVASRLRELGALVVDADAVARDLVAAGTPGLAAVVAEFGTAVLAADGSLDRAALSALVFADADADAHARARLNAILHPLVARRSAELVAAAPPDAVVVHDVPLLVENGLAPGYELVVVVEADEVARIRRLRADRGMSEQDIRGRMSAQATDAQRRAVADVVLGNSGSLAELHEKVDRLWADRLAPVAG
ncbi:MAG: dephospho-CoA kinase [Geodermatophilaceae bacterium]